MPGCWMSRPVLQHILQKHDSSLRPQLLRSDEGAEYSAMDASADGNTAYLADKDGALEVVDTRQSADAKPATVSDALTCTCLSAERWIARSAQADFTRSHIG